MKKSLFIAIEEDLEINKLQEQEKQAAKTGGSEVLFDELSQQKKASELTEENKEDETSTDSSVSGDEEETPEDTETTDDFTVAKEELRNLTFAVEAYADDAGDEKSILTKTMDMFSAVFSSISYLGVTYGPKIFKFVYKGVLRLFGDLAKLLYVGTETLMKFIERHQNSLDTLQKSIDSLRKALDLVKDADTLDVKFSNQKVINALKISESVDFSKNVQVLDKFLTGAISAMSDNIGNEISAINHLITYCRSGTSAVPESLMQSKLSVPGMVEGTIEGFPVNESLTKSFRYSESLPSDITLLAIVPRQGLETFEELAQAYNLSKLYLALDVSKYKEVANIDYMTKQQLSEFLNELEKLCKTCVEHKHFYEKIRLQKGQMKIMFKNFFEFVANRDRKLPLKSTLVEQVYLKSMFIDKVYLTAAMDIHDYTAKVISSGLSFIEDNIKKLPSQ